MEIMEDAFDADLTNPPEETHRLFFEGAYEICRVDVGKY